MQRLGLGLNEVTAGGVGRLNRSHVAYRLSVCALLSVLMMVSPSLGQNLLVNPGFNDPQVAPQAIVRISGNVADGDTLEIDVTGVNRIYEFDTNGSVASGNVRVNVSGGVDKVSAKNALIAAVNGDAGAPCTAADGGTGSKEKVRLTWKNFGACGITNTNSHDTNNTLEIDSSFSYPAGDTPNASFPGWDDSTLSVKRNDTWGVPPCREQSRMGYSASNFTRYTYQTVSGLPSEPFDYTFSGLWAHTVIGSGTANYTAEVYAGTDPNLNLLTPAPGSTGSYSLTGPSQVHDYWSPFAVNVTKPAGVTALTVVLKTTTSANDVALHVEDTSLVLTTCPILPSITDITPQRGVRGTNPLTLTVNGTGLVGGSTTVKLVKSGEADVVGTNVNVMGGGTTMTADFNLTGMALGTWSVNIAVNGCPATTAVDAFMVILPAFSNGSFELPDPGTSGCPVTPVEGVPTDWLGQATVYWKHQNRLNRDGWVEDATLSSIPSCPPPDGQHYATMATVTGGSSESSRSFQTIAVTNGSNYTFSGYFAGSGNNTVTLRLREGGLTGPQLAESTVHSGGGTYDWQFASVSAAASGDVMTAEWAVAASASGENAAHADGLSFEECTTPITSLTAITPNMGVNNGVVNITSLTGSGFAGTPAVQLVKGGTSILADPGSVIVVNPNQVTCSFDLTGKSSGKYDVVVKQGGCVAVLAGGFTLVAESLMNGSFEEPTAPVNLGNCIAGDAPEPVTGLPTGWNTDAPDGMIRDGNAPLPPNNGTTCIASSDGGHYGSMSASGTLRAWQTVRVVPTARYRFSGQFAGVGFGNSFLRLIDGGDVNGTDLTAPVDVFAGGGSGWVSGQIEANAVSSVMTVIWEIQNAAPGGHADGLSFGLVGPPCNDPFADADGDGDVDQDDFAKLQVCVTGPGLGVPTDCGCFDHDFDGDIDQSDAGAFGDCASGPGVAADPDCD